MRRTRPGNMSGSYEHNAPNALAISSSISRHPTSVDATRFWMQKSWKLTRKPHCCRTYTYFRAASLASVSFLAPVHTMLPDAKHSAVVRGSTIRAVAAANFFGLYSTNGVFRARSRKHTLSTPRLNVHTTFCISTVGSAISERNRRLRAHATRTCTFLNLNEWRLSVVQPVRNAMQPAQVCKYPCGTEYTGEVVNGVPHGVGYLFTTSGVVCRGQFHNGEAHGMASQLMPNGDIFTGEFQCGRRYGDGVYQFAAGVTVHGTWADGVFLRLRPRAGSARSRCPGRHTNES